MCDNKHICFELEKRERLKVSKLKMIKLYYKVWFQNNNTKELESILN